MTTEADCKATGRQGREVDVVGGGPAPRPARAFRCACATCARRHFLALGFGVGLRPPHYAHVLETRPAGRLVRGHLRELHGRRRAAAARARAGPRATTRSCCTACRCRSARPIRSTATICAGCARWPTRIEPAWISDHLCWTGVGGHNLHDLLPLPVHRGGAGARRRARRARCRTRSAGASCSRTSRAISTFRDSTMTEWEFLGAVAERADCAHPARREQHLRQRLQPRLRRRRRTSPAMPVRARRPVPPRRALRPRHAPARHARPPGVRGGVGRSTRRPCAASARCRRSSSGTITSRRSTSLHAEAASGAPTSLRRLQRDGFAAPTSSSSSGV